VFSCCNSNNRRSFSNPIPRLFCGAFSRNIFDHTLYFLEKSIEMRSGASSVFRKLAVPDAFELIHGSAMKKD
jgi:hypothetical protein